MYVPTYLTDVRRGDGGWPVGLSALDKAWLIAFCRDTLEAFGPCSVGALYDMFKYREDHIKIGPLLDYAYACIDRACREVAEPVWKLKG